ncbi:MAG: DUF309 domain-containing protein [Actinomycetota bacterium]
MPADGDREQGAKTKRPRDELGRLLAWDAENRLEMEDFDALSLEECHRLGIEHFNAGRFFPAHEAWESAWKKAKRTEDEEFFKGLSQLGAGYVHYERGNKHGAKTLLRRGLGRVETFVPERRGVQVEPLVKAARRHAHAIEEAQRKGSPMPHITPPGVGGFYH